MRGACQIGIIIKESSPKRAYPLLALAVFVSISGEFLPAGLIPHISLEFDRSIPEAGTLVGAFAFSVVVFAIPSAWATRNLPPKIVLLTSLALITLGLFATSVAPTFEILMGARVLGGAAHGLFWSVTAAYIAQTAPPMAIGRANAVVATGGTLASILGLPLGNALGQLGGWRLSFLALAVVAAALVPLLALFLPKPVDDLKTEAEEPVNKTWSVRDRASLKRVAAYTALLALIVACANSYGTYSVTWLELVAKIPGNFVPFVLIAGGLLGAVGLLIVHRHSDRQPWRLTFLAWTAAITAFFLLWLLAGLGIWIAPFSIIGGVTFSMVPTILQIQNMRAARPRIRRLAGSLQTTAVNIGAGLGSFVGASFIGLVGLQMLPLAAAGGLLVLLVIALFAVAVRRMTTRALPESQA